MRSVAWELTDDVVDIEAVLGCPVVVHLSVVGRGHSPAIGAADVEL